MLPWFAPGMPLYWSRSRRLFWCWRRSRSRCFVLATGAAGSVRFGVCATGLVPFSRLLAVFSVQSPPADERARSGRTFSGLRFRRVTRCIPLRTGATVAGSVGNVELTATCSAVADFVAGSAHCSGHPALNTLLTIRCRRDLPLSRRRRIGGRETSC